MRHLKRRKATENKEDTKNRLKAEPFGGLMCCNILLTDLPKKNGLHGTALVRCRIRTAGQNFVQLVQSVLPDMLQRRARI